MTVPVQAPFAGVVPSLPDKVLAIDEVLDAERIPHAIGGALALAYYAEPRATIDIDLNVFVPPEDWQKVVEAVKALGVDTANLDSSALVRDGQCRLWWGDNPVDLFFSNAPIHEAMRRATRRVPFAGRTIQIVAPEHLMARKTILDRPKDWLDIEQMFLATDDLDACEIERWLVEMVGEDDRRLQRLREMRAKLRAES